MKLPPRALVLKRILVKEKPVLALDTGFEADSIEGLRLVKASRGSGWLYRSGTLIPWTTKGVLQEEGRLVVWGDLDDVPEGSTPESWPRSGTEGRDFLKALVLAWTARSAVPDPLSGFTSSSVVPFRTADGWAFVFPPPELRAVLDSLQPLGDRLAWDHFRHPDADGTASWAFTSAALGWDLVGDLPWAQEEEAHLRQEIRDLKKTLSPAELPDGPDPETSQLWYESLTGRLPPASAAARWSAWAAGQPSWTSAPDPVRAQQRQAAAARRTRRRAGASFWRRKGTVTVALAAAGAVVLAVAASVVWGMVKPDPTDVWTPEQVVEGYYRALSGLDAETMEKLTDFDKGREPHLSRDQDEVSNVFVIRQVRTAYEHQSPVVEAEDWEKRGRPALSGGQMLFGAAGIEISRQGGSWTVRYRKWVSDAQEGQAPLAVGFAVVDTLTLKETSKGWKISSLQRERQPLP